MDPFDAMDDATAALILQIQMRDTAELFNSIGGRDNIRADALSDTQLAAQAYLRDLELNYSLVTNRVMSRNNDVPDYFEAPAGTNDDYIAFEFADEYMTKDQSREMGSSSSTGRSLAESSTQAGSKRRADPLEKNCAACNELHHENELAPCPCGHGYCKECLSSLFRASITDDSLFPPRCCRQPIFSSEIQSFLSLELIDQYQAKKIEHETPNRTYCSNPQCSIFIRPEYIAKDRAACPQCDTVTCITCKSRSHIGDCPADTDLQRLLDLAKENGWQRCFHCRRVVELEIGCNHMTCPCGTEFCYVCAARWKTCACEQWDEEMLVARAHVVVNRDDFHHNAIPNAEQIAVVMQNLRLRHNCNHDEWRWIRGSFNCEGCHYTLHNYIFECLQCSIRVCKRCRRNRI